MVNLELDFDEGILLQTTEVERYGFKELSLDEMILTNKNIICVYQKSNGVFAKSDTIVEKIPLSTIKVVNGQAQVMMHDSDDYGKGVQLLFVSGHREHFIFSSSPKKTMPIWVEAINKAIIGDVNPVSTDDIYTQNESKEPKKEKKSVFGSLAGTLGNIDIQSAVEKAQSKLSELPQQVADKVQTMYENAVTQEAEIHEQETNDTETTFGVPPIPQTENNDDKYTFCSNCGTKLNIDARFCHSCGAKIVVNADEQKAEIKESMQVNKTVSTTNVKDDSVEQIIQTEYTERKTVYEGKIHKCPNCGDIIDAYETVCETCGYEIRGRKATSSVRELQTKLEGLHAKRPQKKVRNVFSQALSGGQLSNVDEEIVNLIKNFSIPNTKEDITEFMILASSNIDIKVYGVNSQQYQMRNPAQREISDAWLAKFEQAYQKSKMIFGTSTEFQKIHNIYEQKNKEISRAKKKIFYVIFGSIGGLVLYFIIMFALIGGIGSSDKKQIEAENARLNTIVEEVYTAIEDENYAVARAKASTLVFSVHNGYSNEHEEDWKDKKSEIMSVIDKAEGAVSGENDNNE